MDDKPLITRDLKTLLKAKKARTIQPAHKGRAKHRVMATLVFVGMVWLGVNSVASIPSISQWATQSDAVPSTKPDAAPSTKRHLVTYFHNNVTSTVQNNEHPANTDKEVFEHSSPPDKPSKSAQDKARVAQEWKSHTIRRGDTLEKIFKRWGIQTKDAVVVANLKDAKADLKLKPGRTLRMQAMQGNKLQELRYELGLEQSLAIKRDGDQFKVEKIIRTLDVQHRVTSGAIKSSLFKAGNDVGMSDKLIMQLVTIFGWDIDFALDLRRGDKFSIIFEEKYWKGEKLSDGDIVAAEFRNRGEVFRAIRHTDSSGYATYFTPKGMSMRRAFLKTPLEFSRITSGFSRKRYHPVLKRWRAHKGVDYGAPQGTPILATADGRIRFVGRKGGYGKTIVLKHGGHYSTLYGHLSRYAKGLRNGKTIRQGQTIGFVGKTGLATGPHLHYEFRVNSVHRNPLTFKHARALPIKKTYRQEFLKSAEQWVAQLQSLNSKPLASVEKKSSRRAQDKS
ncbi:peptidoglycan DD-metalloendopeptidase family protein [Pseudomonadota bacterium]